MATTLNAFDLLKGAESTLQQKKKKKSKAKKAVDTIPVAEAVVEHSSDEQIVEQAEACAVLEKSARTFKTGGDRVKLWKDWCRQANERSAKSLKYRGDDGNLIHFKELVLRSRALEITIEGCVTSPLTSEQTNSLQQLLSTFIPNVDSTALASSIARLAQLLSEDTQSFDTTGAAQRAVHNVISSLKTAKAGAEPASKPASLHDRLFAIDREASKQQGFLASVEKLNSNDPLKPRMPGQGSGISKAHVDSAREIAKLLGEKFDLLQPNSAALASKAPAGSGPSQATIKCLEELKDIIGNHLKEARGIEESVRGAAVSKEAQRAQAVAALRREEAVLAQQAADIAGQIRVLESQLAQLKGQAAEVEDKRVRLQQRQAAALEALGASTGRKMSGLSAQHYNEELVVADQLLQLVDPSRVIVAADQLAAAQEEHGSATAQYMAAVRNMLQMSSSSLADVPGKVVFCRQRIAQAEKLSSLGGVGKEKSAKTREEAEKLLADTVKHSEDILTGAQVALEGMRSRFPAFSPQQQAELSQAAYEVEDMMSHIRGQYELAMAAMRGQAPATPTPAVGAYGQAPQPAGAGAPVLAPVTGGFGAPVVRPAGALGPVMPPPAASAPSPAATSNGSHVQAPIAAPVAGPRPVAPVATPAAADGFQQVGGKKNRRKA